jgi:predicted transcriptional regulator
MSEKFYKISTTVMDKIEEMDLSKSEIVVYLRLKTINPFGDSFKTIEIKALANLTKMSESSVRRSLHKLEAKNLIKRSDDGYLLTSKSNLSGMTEEVSGMTEESFRNDGEFSKLKEGVSEMTEPQKPFCTRDAMNELIMAHVKLVDSHNKIVSILAEKVSEMTGESFNSDGSFRNDGITFRNENSSFRNDGKSFRNDGKVSEMTESTLETTANKEFQNALDYIDSNRLNKTFLDWSEEKNNLNFQNKENGVNKIEEKDVSNQTNLSENKQGLSQKQEDVGKDKLAPQVEQSTEIVAVVKQDPFFNKPRNPNRRTQIEDWIPEGPWKTTTQKGWPCLDWKFVDYVARNMFVKEFGNTEDQAFANATNYFKNDVNRIPIQWEAYQHHSFKAAASIQAGTQATGVIKEADVAKLESVSTAFQQMPEHLQVTDKSQEFTLLTAQTKTEDALPPAPSVHKLKAIEAIVTPTPVVAMKPPSSAEEYLKGMKATTPQQEEEATPEQKAEFFKAYRQMLFKGVGKKMEKLKEDRKTSQIEQWRTDIHDPILQAKVVKEVNASGRWYVEYNENGYPIIRENNDFIPEFTPKHHQENFIEVEAEVA